MDPFDHPQHQNFTKTEESSSSSSRVVDDDDAGETTNPPAEDDASERYQEMPSGERAIGVAIDDELQEEVQTILHKGFDDWRCRGGRRC